MKDDQLRAVADQVGRAIEAEEANAAELMRTADEFPGSQIADHLRRRARGHRVRGLELQGRLAGWVAMIRRTRGR